MVEANMILHSGKYKQLTKRNWIGHTNSDINQVPIAELEQPKVLCTGADQSKQKRSYKVEAINPVTKLLIAKVTRSHIPESTNVL